VLLLNSLNIFCQPATRTIVKGTVTDANTGEPVPYVSILLKGTTVGTLTDNSGKYIIETTVKASEIAFSFLGYERETRSIIAGSEQIINISLRLSSINLTEVTVKPQRNQYRNKGNPAVELIEKVISHKSSNRRESFDFLEYEKYDKVELALSNVSENFENSSIFKKYSFIFDNIDTTKRIANDVLPIFLKESISDHFYRKEPEAEKDIKLAEKDIDLQEYLDIKGVSANLNYIYQNINIYDNEILFLTNKFLSPVAVSAPTFYRYYITDTLQVRDIKCIKLFFEPRNRADFLFHGNLYITLDSIYAIREIDMGLNKYINIDWVKDISIKQDFENFGENNWLLSREEISIDLGILKNSLGLYAQRSVSYSNYKINEPVDESLFSGPEMTERIEPASRQQGFWDSQRPIPLSKNERALYSLVDSVKSVPAFKRQMGILMLITTEFYDFGKFEMGPVGSFYSFNPVEGSRFRFGGRTTPAFSRKVTLGGYMAYGTRDRMFKYNAGVTYSFTPRTIYEFPVKSVTLSIEKDLNIPGQQLQFSQRDNLFLSLNRGVNDKMLLNSTMRLEFFNEFENHFSFLAGYSYTNQQPRGTLRFETASDIIAGSDVNSINISEFYLNLRYARDETFYQGKLYRDRFPNKYPVIQLNTAFGLKQIDNGYDYLRLQLNISRRYYISIIGYTDVTLEAGKIFGTVPYPLLFIHRANQSYAYQKDSYNLMNFLEFVSDRYASINIDHSFNGFILNKIPLMKRLKFREIVTFKMIYGNLASMNNPENNNELFRFPVDENNLPITYSLGQKPYIEAGVGLSNILRIFRVDLIKRFTYLRNPDVTDVGFRVQFRLDI